jgi:pimeloyl-ACP methyl ester carboxylesterase
VDLWALADSAVHSRLHLPAAADLPPARMLEVPGRGSTLVTDLPGPAGAPTLLLLHSLGCTARLTWFAALSVLSERYRVVTFDQRWHGHGFQGGRRFRLDDCADDAAAVADALGIGRFVAVGYSMGGVVAQLLWRRHRERVAGLVLAATCRNFRGTRREWAFFAGLPPVLLPLLLRSPSSPEALVELDPDAGAGAGSHLADAEISRWAWREFRATRPGAVSQALADTGRFNSAPWIGEVDVPAAVVVTTRDTFLPTRRQRKLAAAIPEATVHEVAANHAACVVGADRFVPALVEACGSVADRLPARRARRRAASFR